jgi:hypothetical protein
MSWEISPAADQTPESRPHVNNHNWQPALTERPVRTHERKGAPVMNNHSW